MIGTGIFTTSGFIMEELGRAWQPSNHASLLVCRRHIRSLQSPLLWGTGGNVPQSRWGVCFFAEKLLEMRGISFGLDFFDECFHHLWNFRDFLLVERKEICSKMTSGQ